ncbi:alpha/beta hydrolase [Parapedobacter indicus]|uniref:Acetyl xylan esterase (AXE1) n=1 Tax=Parapedobacter indicus TaxID=1477437 RepID=A0A1I3HPS3_9SPHI|nr:acetylxylan esterase [Parapedobacter indicus]PPL03123.1 acetyl xylan esterase AXE1 [Parapedobacter indicus]SFI37735.1 Acetyl xylan esterase (AXE1) [Parapedobacter indicus]
MMKLSYFFLTSLTYLLHCSYLLAQERPVSENNFREPLFKVVDDMEKRHHITIQYDSTKLADLWVDFAQWRYRGTPAQTLANVLAPLPLSYRQLDDSTYRITSYEYFRKHPKEGKQELAQLMASYQTLAQWESRSGDLSSCIRETLGLQRIHPSPIAAAIKTPKRQYNGYTVENIAIEALPGLYVAGSLYVPTGRSGKLPAMLCPNGHFASGRYRPDHQLRCAMLARMGVIALSYDLVGYGESLLQLEESDHRRSLTATVQLINNLRMLDFIHGLPAVDTSRIGITGASGGGSQSILVTALDDRIKLSVPVVMVSSYFSGGCPCETGAGHHFCGGGTNNTEIAAMAAPRPQLLISDGNDWTADFPTIDLPYLKYVYGLYDRKNLVQNIHLPDEKHDYGPAKRQAMYAFVAEHFSLEIDTLKDPSGHFSEEGCVVEEEARLYAFGMDGQKLPSNALQGFVQLQDALR